MKNKILKTLLILSLFISGIFFSINNNINAEESTLEEDTGFIWTLSKDEDEWLKKILEKFDDLELKLASGEISESEYSILLLELQEERDSYETEREAITLTAEELRNGDIIFQNIPYMIQYSTNFILKFIGSIAMLVIIYWAFMFAFGSLSSDKSKWRDAIIYWLMWFVVASLAWVILNTVVVNLASLTNN